MGDGELEIRTDELLELARQIAGSDPPVDVPEGILLYLNDVIDGREGCAEWYAAQALAGGGKVAKENETHKYFIEILHTMRDILKAARVKFVSRSDSASETKASSRKGKKKAAAYNKSLFQSLDIEEPVANPLGSAPLSKSATAHSPAVSFKLEKEHDDNAFKTWCFLQDLADIRIFVKQAWEDYVKGELSFVAASIISDTAFGLLRNADDEFAKSSPFGSTDWEKLLEYLSIGYSVSNNAIWMHPRQRSNPREPRMPDSHVNIVELLCPIAFLCLQSWQIEANVHCEAKKSMERSWPNQSEKYISVPMRGNYEIHDICRMFNWNAREIHELAHQDDGKGPRDEFLRGLLDIHHNSSIPMHVVVACQVYLDILDLLSHHAFDSVLRLRAQAGAVHDMHVEVKAFNPSNQWTHPDVRTAVSRLENFHSLAAKRAKHEIMAMEDSGNPKSVEEAKAKKWRCYETSLMCTCFPAYAGIIVAETELNMCDLAIAFATHGDHLLIVAHIYRALRTMGLLKQPWQDMEFAIASFAPQDPLVAEIGPVYQPKDARNHFLMAHGTSLEEIRRLEKKAQSDPPKSGVLNVRRKGARGIYVSSPLLDALCDRADVSRQKTDRQTFEKVILALKAPEGTTVNKLLATLRKRLRRDEPFLNFNNIRLTIDCAGLLDSLLVQLGAPHDPNTFDALCVQALLLGGADSWLCREAADILSIHIAEHDKQYKQRAFDKSSGSIPKYARPSFTFHRDHLPEINRSFDTVFDHLDIKFSKSGHTLAAYHSQFDPDAARNSANTIRKLASKDGVSAVSLHNLEIPFSKGLSKQIWAEADAKMGENKSGNLKNPDRRALLAVAEQNAKGEVSDAHLRQIASCVSDHQLVKLTVPKSSNDHFGPMRDMWVFRVEPEHKEHAFFLDKVMAAMGSTEVGWKEAFEKHWLAIPIALWANSYTDDADLNKVIEDTKCCTWAAFSERMMSDPAKLLKDLEGMTIEESIDPATGATCINLGMKGRKPAKDPMRMEVNFPSSKTLSKKASPKTATSKTATSKHTTEKTAAPKPFFGPPRPPHML